MSGYKNPKWRADLDVTYEAMHRRVLVSRGKPSTYPCVHCETKPAEQWAYDRTDPDERRNSPREEGPFSLDVNRYLPLCIRCHKRFDLAWIKANRV